MSKALILSEISKILSSGFLFCTDAGKEEFLAELYMSQNSGSFLEDMPTYAEKSTEVFNVVAENTDIPLTIDYEDAELDTEAIAYYRIKGMIMGESRWWGFSTKQFAADFQAAENNPMIMAHFIEANSGGGDVWYLDEAHKIMMNRKKPLITRYERVNGSACLYLTSPSTKLYAATSNCIVGSLGTMTSFPYWQSYYEKEGVKFIEEYATKSTLKNKDFRDLLKGGKDAKNYIEKHLDPIRDQFEAAVRKAIPKVGSLDAEHPLFKGDTFYTQEAINIQLIDGQRTLSEALNEAYVLGQKYLTNKKTINSAFNYLNK